VLYTEKEKILLTGDQGKYTYQDVVIELERQNERLGIYLTADRTPVCRLQLSWELELEESVRILGDAWERGYGDLEWRGIVPERIMPWYVLIKGEKNTFGYGVKTGAHAMCFWKVDGHFLRVYIDVKNGGRGVELKGRKLLTAAVVCMEGKIGATAYETAREFCRFMCDSPRIPDSPVFGSNNWYYAYGKSSSDKIMEDARLLAELSHDSCFRPYLVIDDGWQASHTCACSGGPWDRGNYRFPNMKELADEIKKLNIHPGLWFRPLCTYECYPEKCILKNEPEDKVTGAERYLDPSHPYVLEKVEDMMRMFVNWGYELIKHDFSTYDILGRWGFEMGDTLTDGGWNFYDRSRTTAEIILDFYQAVRKGAGEDILILGCNTLSHLSAGIFDIQRTGDDTSGTEWERTRKMGINTLAFRMPQNGTFYMTDADCAGITEKISWQNNKEWIALLAESGTPLFVSVDAQRISAEEKEYIKAAFRRAVEVRREAVPQNWMDTTCPDIWNTDRGIKKYKFPSD